MGQMARGSRGEGESRHATAFIDTSFYSIADAYCLTFRACVGRNLASMELQIIISSVFARYEFELLKPGESVSCQFDVYTFLFHTRVGYSLATRSCVFSSAEANL
jgi:hypothetical protein